MSDEIPTIRAFATIAGVTAATYLVLVVLAQILRRVRGLRFTPLYHAFALSAGVLLGLHLAAWTTPLHDDLLRHVTAATLLLAAAPIVTLLNRALWGSTASQEGPTRAPRVLEQATGIFILILAILATLQFVYEVQVPGLLAGSGVVALVLGLGMQDQLHNLFAGLSIHFTKPFKVGDWLLIDGYHAKVIEISWRDTRLLTTDEMMIEIGNAEITKQIVTNFEEPTPRHAVRATIGLHYNVPPARAQAVLKEAAASVPGVCVEPAPVVYVKDFADSAVVYEIKVWIDDHALTSRVLSDVRSHAWYAVNRAGMEIPYPQLTLHRAPKADGATAARAAALTGLQAHPLFGFIGGEELQALVQESRVLLFAGSERIIKQGTEGASLFLLIRGQVDVHIDHGGKSSIVATLGPGNCFGEMSLLAGEPRTATVITQGEVEVIEIGKPAFASVVRANPAIVERLGELLTERQLANARHAATLAGATSPAEVRKGIVRKLRTFFELG